jgi:hypothetical protein
MCEQRKWKDLLEAPGGHDHIRDALYEVLLSSVGGQLKEGAPEQFEGTVVLSDHAMEQMFARNIDLMTVLTAITTSKPRMLRQHPLCMFTHNKVRVVGRRRQKGVVVVVSAFVRRSRSKKRKKRRDVVHRDDGNKRIHDKLERQSRRFNGSS